MRLSPVLGILLIAALQGCAAPPDVAFAEQAVVKFHNQLDAGQAQDIYAQSADEMKKDESERVMVAVFGEAHLRLGQMRSSKLKDWSINYLDSGNAITLRYQTTYANGVVNEEFRYVIRNHQALLAGYTEY